MLLLLVACVYTNLHNSLDQKQRDASRLQRKVKYETEQQGIIYICINELYE